MSTYGRVQFLSEMEKNGKIESNVEKTVFFWSRLQVYKILATCVWIQTSRFMAVVPKILESSSIFEYLLMCCGRRALSKLTTSVFFQTIVALGIIRSMNLYF